MLILECGGWSLGLGSWRADRYIWALILVVTLGAFGTSVWHVFVSPLLTPNVLLVLEGVLACAMIVVATLAVKWTLAWAEQVREHSRASSRLESLVRGEEDE